ncbi:Zn-dependent hydrolase [Rubrobacter taiwanensis]|uniref:Zn-dependent hydrolase n=1 Tax=Rubrobacter taiwanensis TaxID=185139 RepID=A0A4R1BLK4_9ACTN|nr:Zn-dependent hydrolase [Rubrobacter taiwanensis]TCJ18315.1 Zn-dependent hydrolase [Rubrobacter taiwanensis]
MDAGRVEARLEELFELARDPGGGATRPAYSPEEAQAMRLVAEWMEEAGLSPRLDGFGNLWGLPPGAGRFVTGGSHVDTVPNGGRHDGALGTVLALEAAEGLDGPFGVLVCAAEEAPRFGAGTLGSRRLAGKLSDEDLAQLRDAAGVSALEARAGFLELLAGIPRLEDADPLSRVAAHVEVHIEQRRDLRERGAPVGVATAVAGPARYRLVFAGTTGHSGETRMPERRDALCAAAETILLVERLARGAASTVATVGTVGVEPGSLTAIPGRVELGLDVRSTDPEEREELVAAVARGSGEIAARRGVRFSARKLSAAAPVLMDGRLVELVERVARSEGIPALRCESHAGHDAQHLAERVPAALLFAASANGVSHAPEEAVDRRDLEQVLALLAALMPELARRYGGGER